MKLVMIAALAVLAVAAAAPPPQYRNEIKILNSESTKDDSGSYRFNFDTEDGVSRQEVGELKQVPDEKNQLRNVVVVRGSYTYYGEDGKPITITYYADEFGYHAEGDAIPKV